MAKLTPAQIGQITAAETHGLIGGFVFYLLSVYFPGSLWAVGVAYGGLFVVELWKEGSWDMAHEVGATYAGGLLDGAIYYVGAGIALVALILTHRPL